MEEIGHHGFLLKIPKWKGPLVFLLEILTMEGTIGFCDEKNSDLSISRIWIKLGPCITIIGFF